MYMVKDMTSGRLIWYLVCRLYAVIGRYAADGYFSRATPQALLNALAETEPTKKLVDPQLFISFVRHPWNFSFGGKHDISCACIHDP
jgi:hypothetical protein